MSYTALLKPRTLTKHMGIYLLLSLLGIMNLCNNAFASVTFASQIASADSKAGDQNSNESSVAEIDEQLAGLSLTRGNKNTAQETEEKENNQPRYIIIEIPSYEAILATYTEEDKYHLNKIGMTPEQMAHAQLASGSGSDGNDNSIAPYPRRVFCVVCNGLLDDLNEGDDPLLEHERLYPDCLGAGARNTYDQDIDSIVTPTDNPLNERRIRTPFSTGVSSKAKFIVALASLFAGSGNAAAIPTHALEAIAGSCTMAEGNNCQVNFVPILDDTGHYSYQGDVEYTDKGGQHRTINMKLTDAGGEGDVNQFSGEFEIANDVVIKSLIANTQTGELIGAEVSQGGKLISGTDNEADAEAGCSLKNSEYIEAKGIGAEADNPIQLKFRPGVRSLSTPVNALCNLREGTKYVFSNRWLDSPASNSLTSLICFNDIVYEFYTSFAKCSSGSCPDNEELDKYQSLSFTPKPALRMFGSAYQCTLGTSNKIDTFYAEKLVVNATLVNPTSAVVTIGGSIAGFVIGGAVTGGLAAVAAGLGLYYYKNSRLASNPGLNAEQGQGERNLTELDIRFMAATSNAADNSEQPVGQGPEDEAGTEETAFMSDTNTVPANPGQPEEE